MQDITRTRISQANTASFLVECFHLLLIEAPEAVANPGGSLHVQLGAKTMLAASTNQSIKTGLNSPTYLDWSSCRICRRCRRMLCFRRWISLWSWLWQVHNHWARCIALLVLASHSTNAATKSENVFSHGWLIESTRFNFVLLSVICVWASFRRISVNLPRKSIVILTRAHHRPQPFDRSTQTQFAESRPTPQRCNASLQNDANFWRY